MNDSLSPIAEQLASGEVTEIEIRKDDASQFFAIIRKRPDFKYFHGTAKKGGHVVYRYIKGS